MDYSSSDDSDMELLQIIIDCDEDSDSDADTLPVQKVYKERVNYMNKLNDYEFTYRFRLSKVAVNELNNLLQPYLSVTSKRCIMWISSDSDADTLPVQKVYKERVNYMNKLNDYEFTYRFRLSKVAVNELNNLLQPYLSVTSKRNHGISPIHQILLALRFYALGTMLVSVADFIGVSIASASRIVSDVSRAIARLYPNFVELQSHTQLEFYNIARFPRLQGAIDGTHILIQSPNSNIGEEFRNRKGIFSINVQFVCTASLVFQNVVARWPGSTHDATIFNHSDLKDHCEQGGLGNRWLLGDSGYPCKPYLLTPLLNPNTPSEHLYNESHIKTRNTIERCIGVWKRRFPILALKMRLKLENMQAVIIATAVLHNIARSMNLQEIEPEISIPDTPQENNMIVHNNYHPAEHTSERQSLINNYFNT